MPAGFHSLKIAEVHRETKDAVSVTFDLPDHLSSDFQYKAGQYLTFSMIIEGEEVRRSYSLCSSPITDAKMSIAVKAVDGGKMSNHLNTEIKAGDSIDVMPPMGKFIIEPDSSAANNYMLFGGGSGITPLLSIIKTALAAEPNSKCILVYSNRDEESIIFENELNDLETQHENFKVIHTLDNPKDSWSGYSGFLTIEKISELARQELGLNYPVAQYYTCGPSPLMDIVVKGLSGIGVRDENIHTEYFTAKTKDESENDSSDSAATSEALNFSEEVRERNIKVEVFGEQKEINVKPEETILIAAQREGMDPPYSCTVGVCTTCRARLRSGKANMEEREGLSDAEIDEGYILTCQAHPLSDDVDLIFE